MALLLARRGAYIKLYERRPDIRRVAPRQGRSIALVLSARGWSALDEIGASDAVRAISLPLRGRFIHSIDGRVTFQPYGTDGENIFVVPRTALSRKLIDMAGSTDRIDMEFCQRVEGLTWNNHQVELQIEKEHGGRNIGDMLIGADGARSQIRQSLLSRCGAKMSVDASGYGSKELCIPLSADGNWALDPTGAHFWPRGRVMLAAFPNLDRGFDCSLLLPLEGQDLFESIAGGESIRTFFERHFSDLRSFVPVLERQYRKHESEHLVTILCSKWYLEGQVALIGDAAHTVLPFYGQGMNAGFEDCQILLRCLEEYPHDRTQAFRTYEARRKPDGDALAELSKEHFIELRDRSTDPAFLRLKHIESKLSLRYPGRIKSIYAQVAFGCESYAAALRSSRLQTALIERLAQIPGIDDALEQQQLSSRIETQIAQLLSLAPAELTGGVGPSPPPIIMSSGHG
jgi:kynurenine 3-monooxygenase